MLLTKLPVAVGLAGVALAANAVTYTPGTYTEKVNGHNAAFTVKVTVSKNKIEKIEYPDNLETIGVGKVALDKLSKKIIDRRVSRRRQCYRRNDYFLRIEGRS